MKILILITGVLLLANVAYAESPREQLRQMVEQLQKSPNDDALREKIIKLARTVKPAVPEEAEKFEGRAQFAFKNAKSPADYLDAAKEYEKAVAAAPWVAGYYADLCTIYEKAEKYAEAKKSCEFFLASSPSAQDASDVRKRIAGLEFAMEKANVERKKQDEKLHTTEGLWQAQYGGESSGDVYEVKQINGRFEAMYIGSAQNCLRNLTATAITIEWSTGVFKDSMDHSCMYDTGQTMQCNLRDDKTLDCQRRGLFNGRAHPEWDSKFQMIRRASCKNFRYQERSEANGYRGINSADCE